MKEETSSGQKFRFQSHKCRKIGHKTADCLQKGKNVPNLSEANRSENVGLLSHDETPAAISNSINYNGV